MAYRSLAIDGCLTSWEWRVRESEGWPLAELVSEPTDMTAGDLSSRRSELFTIVDWWVRLPSRQT